MEHEEYTAETYPCSGKKYNGEKAIISLTSWKARINTVSKTLYSLIKQCPGFHIVLVLSEEEFPKKEAELPESLMLFVENNLIELLWVYKNYKSFKKVLFTMDKYRTVPVISADDDCIYICNYAQELYDALTEIKNNPIVYTHRRKQSIWTQGTATIYPAKFNESLLKNFNYNKWKYKGDDDYLGNFFIVNKIKILSLDHNKLPCYFHDEIKPLNGSYRNPSWKNLENFN